MKIGDFTRMLDKSVRCDFDWVKLSKNTSIPHKIGILQVCENLTLRELPFVTEAKFTKEHGGGRADVVSPLSNQIFEILVTESEERFEAKKSKYPKEFTIVPIKMIKVVRKKDVPPDYVG